MNCKQCDNIFKPKVWNAAFCSSACKSNFHAKAYYHRHRKTCLKKKKEYYQDNREDIIKRSSEYCDTRRKIDVDYRLKRHLRSRLYNAVKRGYKSGSAINDLGCTIKQLKKHLESQFQEGMSWNNYGQWHIDHIVPLSRFNLSDPAQFKKACHYSNLQPLWAEDNIRKGG